MRPLLVSKAWVQASILVLLFGFFVLGFLALRTYQEEPPIPARTVGPDGSVLFTGEDVIAGQQIFLKNGLMEYGSILGHGAYLGPDFTADYLRRAAVVVRDRLGGKDSDRARQRTIEIFKRNTYDPSTRTLTLDATQVEAFHENEEHYRAFFSEPTTRFGLRPHAITDPVEARSLTSYFAWTAWAASTLRPGKPHTYTNNWPPEPLVDNKPSADVVLWSVLSLIALLGGIGLMMAVFGRWRFLGWHGREEVRLSFRPPGEVPLTPAQRSTAWYFLVAAALFL